MDEGRIKMNSDDRNLSGNWKRVDLVQQSLVSLFKDDEKSSAPIKKGIAFSAL
jgi:hypothetical protein